MLDRGELGYVVFVRDIGGLSDDLSRRDLVRLQLFSIPRGWHDHVYYAAADCCPEFVCCKSLIFYNSRLIEIQHYCCSLQQSVQQCCVQIVLLLYVPYLCFLQSMSVVFFITTAVGISDFAVYIRLGPNSPNMKV